MPKLAAQLLFVALKTASPRRFLLRYPILIRKLQSLASMAGVLTKPNVVSSQGSWPKTYSDHRGSHPFCATTTCKSSSSSSSPRRSRFLGRKLVLERQNGVPSCKNFDAVHVAMTLAVGNALRWWTKGVHSNMKEIASADDLVNSLTRAGDNLVIVDFFSPGCGGCKFLHQKICQFAEKNPDVIFLQANYEEHKSMCYSLNVHVLPFFRFYRGAHGRLCSFSCTNATIKKFKDALAKHSTARCSLGPAKGLEESELLALASNRDLSFSYSKNEAAIESSSQVQLPMPSLSEFAPSEAVDMAVAAVG